MEGKWDITVVILTFTWSVGFRLADCHVRHLNLVHSWRLEWGREWGWQMKNISLFISFLRALQNLLHLFTTRMKNKPSKKRWIFAYLCGTIVIIRLWGAFNCCFNSSPLTQYTQKAYFKHVRKLSLTWNHMHFLCLSYLWADYNPNTACHLPFLNSLKLCTMHFYYSAAAKNKEA